MTSRLKKAVLKCVSESVTSQTILQGLEQASRLKLSLAPKGKLKWNLSLHNNGSELSDDFTDIKYNKSKLLESGASNLIQFTEISDNGQSLQFEINTRNFIKDVLQPNPTDLSFSPERKKLIVEFSSPNIAKQFHVGHLRSTIIGNFVSNIKKKLGHEIVTMNYLGDWGTQFGLLITGIDLLGYTEDSLSTDTIMKLTNAYVHANRLSLKDDNIGPKSREIFQKLESGDKKLTELWQKLKEWSITDLSFSYKRLGIKFDEYEWESMYSKTQSDALIGDLVKNGMLNEDEFGRKVATIDGKSVPLIKSDGSTLYLLRDIVAFFDRRKRHNFDAMYYVVEDGQGGHFINLSKICEQLDPSTSGRVRHIRFGRITGMSTRKGNNVLLHDVLDEARDRMYEKQMATKTTKCLPNYETADVLGTTAVIVNDLRRHRVSQYAFDWDKALTVTGKSGVQLQYAHCRLCSLLKVSGATLPEGCDPDMLTEPEAVELVLNIARFEEVLLKTEETLDPPVLVYYLFDLMSSINRAFKHLPVKNSEAHLASQRLLLFNTARLVLSEGLELLGVKPLEQM